jgi:hypothetical protein
MGPDVIVPIAGMVTGIIITGFVIIGPPGRAVGSLITYWLGGGRKRQDAIAAPELDELHERLDAMQQQLAEVIERQEFTERLLSKVRQERGLPGAGGAEG